MKQGLPKGDALLSHQVCTCYSTGTRFAGKAVDQHTVAWALCKDFFDPVGRYLKVLNDVLIWGVQKI